MAPDERWLDAAARAIADGADIDWPTLESSAGEADRGVVDGAQIVASIAQVYRNLPQTPGPPGEARADLPDAASPAREKRATWGPLELHERIGGGAYGDVYRAWDPRLAREVALKLLRPSSHPRRRCEDLTIEEGRLLARIRHPNVVTVYGADEFEGLVGLWMEFIHGQSLELELVQRGPMSAEEAARIGIDLCRALGAVHSAGLVHRDVKAQNIMREAGGRIVLMDFGAGCETDREAAGTGLVGTPLYVAPELFSGSAATAGSDIYSLGIVLYHLVTGAYPVTGRSLAGVREAHERRERIALRDVRQDLPDPFIEVVERALENDPADRFADAAVMESALAGALGGVMGPDPAAASRRLPRWVVASAVLGLLAALVFVGSRMPWTPKPLLPAVVTLTPMADTETSNYAAISPDGQLVAFPKSLSGGDELWLNDIGTNRSTQLVPLTRDRFGPLAFSTDGRQLFFGRTRGALWRVAASGGATTQVMANVNSPVSFSPDGSRLAFVRTLNDEETALIVARVDGSGERILATRKTPEVLSTGGPAWSPDGRLVACAFDVAPGRRQAGVLGLDPASGQGRWVAAERWQAVGRLAWLADGSGVLASIHEAAGGPDQVWLIPYPSGAARRLTSDLGNYGGVTVSADSRSLVANRYESRNNLWIIPGGDTGREREITNKNHERYNHVAWTPDGRVVYPSTAGDDRDIWIMNADGTGAKRLTRNAGRNLLPSVTADGRYIVFSSDRSGGGHYHLWRMDIDGQHPVQLTFDDAGTSASSASPDGRWVVFVRGGPGADASRKTLWRIPIDGGDPEPLTTAPALGPDVSPDGRLVAAWYRRSDRDDWQIAIIPLAGGPPVRLLDANRHLDQGGVRWSGDGRAVMFNDTRAGISNLWRQPIDGGPPTPLTQFSAMAILGFDVRQDGTIVFSRQNWANDVVLIRNFR